MGSERTDENGSQADTGRITVSRVSPLPLDHTVKVDSDSKGLKRDFLDFFAGQFQASMEGILRCTDCALAFDTRHALAVHLKSSSHARLVEHRSEVAQLRDKDDAKERRAADFRTQYWPKIEKLFESYQDASHATLGKVFPKRAWAEGATLSDSVKNLYRETRPRPHIRARRKALYAFVFKASRLAFPDAVLEVYGSIPHSIDDETSDIDMSILYQEKPDAVVLDIVAKLIEICPGSPFEIKRVLHARIPVISVVDVLTKTTVDLSIWNIDKKHISEIFTLQLNIDERIRPLVFCIRRWSKAHNINDAFSGFINSFGWTVAIMCFLMSLDIVPVMASPSDLPPDWRPADFENPTLLGDLLVGFLHWFLEWDYKTTRLCMRVAGGVAPKEADRFDDYTFICIERPQTPYQNIVRQVEKNQWTLMRKELQSFLAKLRASPSALHAVFET